MPRPTDINPLTGKRFNWVDPRQAEKEARAQDQEIALLERALKAKQAQDDLLTFTEFTSPDPEAINDIHRTKYKAAPYHRIIAKHLEEVERGDIRQLIFCMPPRHGKSELATRRLAAWYSGRHPEQNVAVAAYSDGMASDFGGDVRAIMATNQFKQVFPKHRLRKGGTAKDNLETAQGGRLVFVGRGGPLTGRGAHCFPAGTMVATTAGPVAIENLNVCSSSVKVLCYDTQNRHLEARSLQAFAHRPATRLLRITTASGRVVDATRDHPFYTPRGYIKADELAVGDGLLQLVLDDGSEIGVRDHKARKARPLGVLLFEQMLGAKRKWQSLWSANLRHLRRASAPGDEQGKQAKHVLLSRLSDGAPQTEARSSAGNMAMAALRRVRDAVSSVSCADSAPGKEGFGPGSVLQHGLQGPRALASHARRAKSRLSAWLLADAPAASLVAGVSPHEAQDIGAGQLLLCTLREGRPEAPCASHWTGPEGQSLAESDHAMRKVPSQASRERTVDRSVAPDKVLRIDEVLDRDGGTTVYDIQVEEHHNFFANGVLVHNCLLIDDLYKDHEEARSQAIRDQAWNWFTKVAMTRRMGKKLVIITMTRWHSDDVIGRLTDPENPHYNAIEAKKWKIIRLPALAEEDDPLGREEGEPLWPDGPDQFDLDFLQSQQRLDPLGFSALYQQRPTVADGVLFRRENIQRYKPSELPENLRYYAASDHAVGTKQRNDPSCFGVAGVDTQDNLYLTDLFWERVATDRAVTQMLLMNSLRRPLIWWAEKGHISQSIGPFLRKRMQEEQNYINLREVTPKDDKETRAQSIAGRVAMGKLYVPYGPIWDKLVEEMLAFPNGIHDDGVDMLSLFGLGLQSQISASRPSPKKEPPKFGTLGWVKENDKWADEKRRAGAAGGF